MTDKDIINFKQDIANYSIDQLVDLRAQLNDNISKMILNCDDVMKIAIIESLLNEKLDKESKDEYIIKWKN